MDRIGAKRAYHSKARVIEGDVMAVFGSRPDRVRRIKDVRSPSLRNKRFLVRLMELWDSSLDISRVRIPRPVDPPQAHSAGPDPDRILIFGAGPAVGWGVGSHDLALPGALARGLSSRTRRGSDVDLVADPELSIENASSALLALQLSRYDAIVVILGVNDALKLTSTDLWRRELAKLLVAVFAASAGGTQVFVAGIPAIRSISIFNSFFGSVADRHATALNQETTKLCANTEGVNFVPFTAHERVRPESARYRHRAPEDFAHWAGLLADSMAPLLGGPRESRASPNPDSSQRTEKSRQVAVDGLGSLGSVPDERLDYIVSLAKRTFHTQSALFTVLDEDLQRHISRAGTDVLEVARTSSFCEFAIGGRDAVVVRDAREDERFRDNPLVVGDPHIRFYAGFPIESPSGERVGALCVIDPQPRVEGDAIDVVRLRELALMIQRELWRYLPGHTA